MQLVKLPSKVACQFTLPLVVYESSSQQTQVLIIKQLEYGILLVLICIFSEGDWLFLRVQI